MFIPSAWQLKIILNKDSALLEKKKRDLAVTIMLSQSLNGGKHLQPLEPL